jgi:hypothetical protein
MVIEYLFRFGVKVLGPALLGFGTIFQPKANATDHWSTSPRIEIIVVARADESGDPPASECDRVMTLDPIAA